MNVYSTVGYGNFEENDLELWSFPNTLGADQARKMQSYQKQDKSLLDLRE